MNYVHLVARRVGDNEVLRDASGDSFSAFAVEVLDAGGPIPVAAAGDDGSIDEAWPVGEVRAMAGKLGHFGRGDGTTILAVGLLELAGLEIATPG